MPPSDLLANKKFYQHSKLGKFHFVGKRVDQDKFLRCGRRINNNYSYVRGAPAFTIHGCQICFGFGNCSERLGIGSG